jgi:NAD+ synthase (glutamine-hydrolysing)
LKIALSQINTTVGDIDGNIKKIIYFTEKAKKFNLDLIIFPELATTGYPPEDLLLKPKFIEENIRALSEIIKNTENIAVILGFVDKYSDKIYNAAGLIQNKNLLGVYHKILLPNYGVFDEKRYFEEGKEPKVFEIFDKKIAINICEDIWDENGPGKYQSEQNVDLMINISASPYHKGKCKEREKMLAKRAKKYRTKLFYCNLVGGQDELVFDGASLIFDKNGKLVARAKQFEEDLLIYEEETKCRIERNLDEYEEIYRALVLGIRDYVLKNNFKKVVIGLSGGIDSSLTATIAVDALGRENVIGVFMPSKYNSEQSKIDAETLAKNLDIKFITIPIDSILKTYLISLDKEFIGTRKDITEENLQARIRGNILMALSNKFGYLVLTTGNKSEMACGYATLYGDMAGGFAPLKDVPKTLVYKVAEWRNEKNKVIPENIFTKAPTAELRENQKDEDTLPPYNLLDKILHYYIEEDRSIDEIISFGFDKEIVLKVINMVDSAEYKRRQAPPGIKITHKAFGKDRRMPITNKFRLEK